MNIKKTILNNIGFKLIALFLAVVTWIYIVGELNKGTSEDRAALERLLPYRMTAKFLPVELNLTGQAAEGFRILDDEIHIDPKGIMVIGPRSLLDGISFVKTEPIDISGHTKDFSKDIFLMPLARGLTIKEKFVSVTIPVEKVK